MRNARLVYRPSRFPPLAAFVLSAFLLVCLADVEVVAWMHGFAPSVLMIALIALVAGFVFKQGYRLFDR